MPKNEIIELLLSDLQNEYLHFHFYLHSACVVRGLHRHELGKLLHEAAMGEMEHIRAFSKVIIGLGGVIKVRHLPFPEEFFEPKEILKYALDMEDRVVTCYVERLRQVEGIGVDGDFLRIFYEEQILDSRQDADNLREMIDR